MLWGPPGTGKTRTAFESDSAENVFIWTRSQNGNSYALGYKGERTVILDDFYGWLPWSLLLQLLDGYPINVNTLGAVQRFRPDAIWITSNSRPRDWAYKYGLGKDYDALKRRITELVHVCNLEGNCNHDTSELPKSIRPHADGFIST